MTSKLYRVMKTLGLLIFTVLPSFGEAANPVKDLDCTCRQTIGDAYVCQCAMKSSPPVPAAAVLPERPSASGLSKVPVSRSQCAAATKRGSRCSRKAAAGALRCWQHAEKASEEPNGVVGVQGLEPRTPSL